MTDTVNVPRKKLEEVRGVLAERIQGSPARSPAHNARVLIDTMLAAAPKAEPVEADDFGDALLAFLFRHGLKVALDVSEIEALRQSAIRAQPEAPKGEQEPVDLDWQSIAMWMGFSASVIKSGEPWTKQCQISFDEAISAYGRLTYAYPALASDELLEALEAALKEARTTLSVTRANIMVEVKRSEGAAYRFEGVPEILKSRIDAIDAVLAKRRRPQS